LFSFSFLTVACIFPSSTLGSPSQIQCAMHVPVTSSSVTRARLLSDTCNGPVVLAVSCGCARTQSLFLCSPLLDLGFRFTHGRSLSFDIPWARRGPAVVLLPPWLSVQISITRKIGHEASLSCRRCCTSRPV
jgi:hypothetical protein